MGEIIEVLGVKIKLGEKFIKSMDFLSSELTKMNSLLSALPESKQRWGSVQNDEKDKKSKAIYGAKTFEDFCKICNPDDEDFGYFAKRWYGFISSGIEERIFCSFKKYVTKEENFKHHDIDIYLHRSDGKKIGFDIKGSVYPKGRNKYETDKTNPGELIQKLVDEASKEKRKHLGRRIFIIFHSKDGLHAKLKADWRLMFGKIAEFILTKDKIPFLANVEGTKVQMFAIFIEK